jgi:hypothetical protein
MEGEIEGGKRGGARENERGEGERERGRERRRTGARLRHTMCTAA